MPDLGLELALGEAVLDIQLMHHFQPECKLLQKWKHILYEPTASKGARKKAIIAVARQLFVDLWRWQTNQVTPEELGWIMMPPIRKPSA